MRICISSGHSTKCQGADDIINEVEEATAVVDEVTLYLRDAGCQVEKFHDTVSTTQNENLNRIVDWHNSHVRDLDVSVHFNAYEHTSKPMGTECLYLTQKDLAVDIAEAISTVSGLICRGGKYRDDLFFLNHTAQPSILIEVAFVDSSKDVELYHTYFPLICEAIADVLMGEELPIPAPEPEPEPIPDEVLFHAEGKCSYFGGPDDTGVSDSEGLAFHYEITEDNQHLFLPLQPAGTSGLARRLNAKAVHYVACRWDYSITPKEMLASDQVALVTSKETGMSQTAFPADWGPNAATERVADLSPALMRDLQLDTDDEVAVIYPWKGD